MHSRGTNLAITEKSTDKAGFHLVRGTFEVDCTENVVAMMVRDDDGGCGGEG